MDTVTIVIDIRGRTVGAKNGMGRWSMAMIVIANYSKKKSSEARNGVLGTGLSDCLRAEVNRRYEWDRRSGVGARAATW